MVQLVNGRRIGLGMVLAGLLVANASGQGLFVQTGGQVETVDCAQNSWAEPGVAVGFDGDRYDVLLQASRSSRCSSAETRFLADTYAVIAGGAYVNFRLVLTPDARFHPESDALIEAFIPRGSLEPSLQVRQMRYPGVTATIVAPSIARYSGDRYYRLQLLGAKAGDDPFSAAATLVGRQYRGRANYVEARVSAGREVTEFRGGLQVSLGYSVGVAARQAMGRVVLMPNAGWADDEILGGRVILGLQVRASLGGRP